MNRNELPKPGYLREVSHGLHVEDVWRQPGWSKEATASVCILASRWTDPSDNHRQFTVRAPANRHVISVALRSTRGRLARGHTTLIAGAVPAGTTIVCGPSQVLDAEFHEPCDFIQFYVLSDCVHRRRSAANQASSARTGHFRRQIYRGELVAEVSRQLTAGLAANDTKTVVRIRDVVVARLLELLPPANRVAPLPKWRLARVETYLERHIDHPVKLADIARTAGLSPMHFAAQFFAATGYQPHHYLLQKRIARAKALLLDKDASIAEIALSVGFQAQAHFTTVFKRLTGETPARWRRIKSGVLPGKGRDRR